MLQRTKGYASGLRPTTQEGLNPKDSSGSLKVPLLNVTSTAKVLTAICMQDGEERYGPYNWRHTPIQARIYLEAAMRHLDALIDGEDYDQQSGKPHIGYALATLMIYADSWINNSLVDNRPVPGKAGELIEAFNRSKDQPDLSANEVSNLFESIVARPVQKPLSIPEPLPPPPTPITEPPQLKGPGRRGKGKNRRRR